MVLVDLGGRRSWNELEKRTETEIQRPAVPVVLTLPGDCQLTQEQVDTFEKFKNSPGINDWYVVDL